MTTAVHGLVTPLAYPYPDEAFSQDAFSTLDDPQPYDQPELSSQYAYLDEFKADHIPSWLLQTPQYSNIHDSPLGYGSNAFHHEDVDAYQLRGQSGAPNFTTGSSLATTAPPTPDFLPIQHFSTTEQQEYQPVPQEPSTKAAGDELVGMGLYDGPENASLGEGALGGQMCLNSFETFNNVSRGSIGKGLKLEETFSPSLDDDEGDEEDDGDEGEENQDRETSEAVGILRGLQTDKTQFVSGRQELPISSLATDLSNHSFFFEHEGELRTDQQRAVAFPSDIWTPGVSTAPYGWI